MNKILAVALIVLTGVFMLSVPSVMAQGETGDCFGNFDGDEDVDAEDLTKFLSSFGRGTYDRPCPPGSTCGGVLSTGQTGCWNSSGVSIACAGTGQDGEYQMGYSRFTDHGDYTVTDNSTGLMWTKQANLILDVNWSDALLSVTGCAYGYCDWRLPNVRELKSLYDSLSFFDGLPMESLPFIGVQTDDRYWSSTTTPTGLSWAYAQDMSIGGALSDSKTSTNHVWPVRGGR